MPIPVPLPMFSFTGNKKSILGDLNFYGKALGSRCAYLPGLGLRFVAWGGVFEKPTKNVAQVEYRLLLCKMAFGKCSSCLFLLKVVSLWLCDKYLEGPVESFMSWV